MAPELESDATVAALMLGGSAVRHLAHHLAGIPDLSITLDVADWDDGNPLPTLRIQIFGQHDVDVVDRLADSLGLPQPAVGGQGHATTQGAWRGYKIRLSTVLEAMTMKGVPQWA